MSVLIASHEPPWLQTASYIRGGVTGSDHVPIGLELKDVAC